VAALSALATLAQVVFSGSRVARDEGDKQGAGRRGIGRSAVSHVPAFGLLFDVRRDAERLENTKHEFDKIYRSAARLVDASPWEIVGLPKRHADTNASLLGELSRIGAFAGPISGVAGLKDIQTSN